MISNWFSPILIGLGQVGAIIAFLLIGDRHAYARRPERAGITLLFCAVHIFIQAVLHSYVSARELGSLPVIEYIVVTLLYYYAFLRLWFRAELRRGICAFIALTFLLIDNCVWPLLSSASRLLWGISYLYSGNIFLRALYCLLLGLLETALAVLVRRLLPELGKIYLDRYNSILTVASAFPFFCIRIYCSQLPTQDNKALEVAMAVCCLVALITLVGGVGRTSQEHDRAKAAQMQQILQLQQLQFQEKLRNIDAVNRKYHDMKNILLYLESKASGESLHTDIEKLMSDIKPYESAVFTGCSTVDIVLSEKLNICLENGINCVPYLEGGLLSFIDPLDLCTLFGNAMDNAIESCLKLERAEDRQISIKTVRKGQSLALVFRNTFEKAPELKDGLPVSTKGDSDNHGYGLKNILYVMQKYKGIVSCQVENREFVLTLLWPEYESD